MKLFVASFFLATSVTVLVAIAPAQTTPQRVSKQRAPGAVRNGTVKICQGLPIPEGYIVVAYMTTSACPHGAYLIKKQDSDLESSAVANKRQDTESENSVAVNKKPDTGSQSPVAVNKKQDTKFPSAVAVNRGAQQPSVQSTAVSRPRRVGTAEPENEAPYLRGVAPPASAGPPSLGGIMPTGAPVNASSNGVALSPNEVAPPGPEEVGEGDVVRIDTALVTVPVSVLDRQGRFVPNLRREDFSVFENGVEQSIVNFEPTEKPFTVALVLDTSASTHFHLWEIKQAAIAFAKQLRPQDRVLVVTFNDEVLLLTEATNDLNVVDAVIEEYANTGDSTRLYDAVDLVVKERLNKIKGRKAIVLFTDGVDTSSYLATYQSTLREAEELDALIYPIQYDTSDYLRAMQGVGSGSVTIVTSSSSWPFPGRSTSQVIYGPSNGGTPPPGTTKADYQRANQYLHELADKTGARLYEANDPAQLAQAFSRIAEELRRQYSLSYYPQASADQSGERRQIKVRVHQPNLAVKARDSYVRSSSSSPTQ
ncbi:MAG: VWA domain-containing protein [Acidobacteriota bacterium]|nr:VWA domain-containing protein [Acidobacteriota bacterium]